MAATDTTAGPAGYTEDELLPLSALQHLLFCERQCALIHLEQAWEENRLTVEGRHLHERVDERDDHTRDGIKFAHGVPLRSLRLGLIGKADVVEYRSGAAGEGRQPFPVEYKRGKPKNGAWDEVQLCAQAICLEEMHGVPVPQGALFYGKTRRRKDVALDGPLRALTEQTAHRLHALVRSAVTPPAKCEPNCRNCSLQQVCLPKLAGGTHSARRYLQKAVAASREEEMGPQITQTCADHHNAAEENREEGPP